MLNLISFNVLTIVLIASLDNADKALLSSSFPMLEKELNLDVKTLGFFSLFTNLSFALALPLWGWLIHRYHISNAHNLLCAACLTWGVASLGIVWSGSSVAGQALFRSLNGAALASMLPLSQTVMVELVPAQTRGRAFGLMLFGEQLAGTVGAAAITYYQEWRLPYKVVGLISILMALVVQNRLRIKPSSVETGPQLSFLDILRRIARIPTFVCLVAQGVFGAVPWDAMSFVLLLLEWQGFTQHQLILYQVLRGLSAVGVWLGGTLGDHVALWPQGRLWLAFTSVLGGIPLWGLFLYSTDFAWSMFWLCLFSCWATWTSAGALRPICAELAQSPSERAQIVALWILLEKFSGAVFGSPLVGWLTADYLQQDASAGQVTNLQKASALRWTLFASCTFFWTVCAVFWYLMTKIIDRDLRPDRKQEPGKSSEEAA